MLTPGTQALMHSGTPGLDFRAGYDAVETGGKARRQRAASLWSEDEILRPGDRNKLVSDTRDLQRNFAVVAWAVRMHLAYVSSFTFQSTTGDKGLDRDLEFLMREWSRPRNCHSGGRHPLRRMIRLCEALRIIDGDVFLVPLEDGKLQIVEGDRVRNPTDKTAAAYKNYKHGVLADKRGRAVRYAVCKRENTGFVLDRSLPAEFVWQHGYFQREDQTRGITPLSAAINPATDAYEGLEYARRRIKIAQLFCLKITREGAAPLGPLNDNDADADEEKLYDVKFGEAPLFLDMKPGDDAEFLDNKTPSLEFQNFIEPEFRLIFSTLDLPYTAYDVRKSTYSGGRMDIVRYAKSSEDKIEDNQDLLGIITDWRYALWIADDVITLPRTLAARGLRYEWVPSGTDWVDPLKEKLADGVGIALGLKSTPQTVKERTGRDAYDVLEEEKEYQTARKSAGLPTGIPSNIKLTVGDEQEAEEVAA